MSLPTERKHEADERLRGEINTLRRQVEARLSDDLEAARILAAAEARVQEALDALGPAETVRSIEASENNGVRAVREAQRKLQALVDGQAPTSAPEQPMWPLYVGLGGIALLAAGLAFWGGSRR